MDNKIIRKNLIEKRLNLSSEEVLLLSKKVAEKVLSLKTIKDAKTVMVYNSIKNEVSLEFVKKELLKENKTLLYPIIKDGIMFAGESVDNLETTGAYNIIEPKNYLVKSDIDVVLVPLVACDKKLNRLGFGKGFYDRFLKDKKTYKIGVCYDFQLVEKINENPWDIKLDLIVTPTQIIK